MSRITRVTKTTTDDQIMAPVITARLALIEKARDVLARPEILAGDILVYAAQRVRNLEALAQVQTQYRNVMASTPGDNARRDFLTDTLLSLAGDTYSGRDNDSMRATYDTIRSWVGNELRDIKYEG